MLSLNAQSNSSANQRDTECTPRAVGLKVLLGIPRRVAVLGVRYLMGVTHVHGHVAINPKVSLTAIILDIEAALKRRAKAEAPNISVEVSGASVTLTGTVHSWSERELARRSAWRPGVHKVVDKITVLY